MQALGLSTQGYAFVYSATATGFVIGSYLNGLALRRHSPRLLLRAGTLGLVLCGSGLVLAAFVSGALPAILLLLFGYISLLGIVVPNAVALAMDDQGDRAGTASAVFGATQFTVAAVASAGVSGLYDGTALPMMAVMVVVAMAAMLAALVCWRATSPPQVGVRIPFAPSRRTASAGTTRPGCGRPRCRSSRD